MSQSSKRRRANAAVAKRPLIAVAAPVTITAQAAEEGNGETVATFDVEAYTGVDMLVGGYDLPVVVDLDGMTYGKSLIANIDHERSLRMAVGHVTTRTVASGKLRLGGVISAATEAARELVESSKRGFPFQASIEAQPTEIEEVGEGDTAEANGQTFNGPLYMVRKSTLSGFAFVSHGADDNTTASIAASSSTTSAGTKKEREMEVSQELREFIEAMLPGTEIEALSDESLKNLEADMHGKEGVRQRAKAKTAGSPFEARKIELKRREELREIADRFCEGREYDDVSAIEKMYDHAIEAKMDPRDFRNEMYEAMVPMAHAPIRSSGRGSQPKQRVLEAAVCQAGMLSNLDDHFSDQELQAAHTQFKGGIGLKELFCIAAESNGYRGRTHQVTLDCQRAAFGMAVTPRGIIQGSGFTTTSLPDILSNVANKFLQEGFNHVDQTALRLADRRPVTDFKEIKTVSLVGDAMFEQLGPAGEIKHGTLGEITYANKADTYAKMYAITREHIVNDDLGALTRLPRRLGRGGMLRLNHIFWTEFLNNSSFFTAGNKNVATGAGSALSLAGLSAAEVIFMNQTDPEGEPLGAMPAILLVPTTQKTTALELMQSTKVVTGESKTRPDTNVFAGRYRVESSPYMENTTFTGNSTTAWYLLADPGDIAVIEIVALNGRVEPFVETADADFNVLGVQMRGYSDVGVRLQEFRGGVRSAGG